MTLICLRKLKTNAHPMKKSIRQSILPFFRSFPGTASARNIVTFVCTIWACYASIAMGANRYVDPASPSSAAPYTSWTTAAHSIPGALAASVSGDVVYVAAGNYSQTSQITIPAGVSLICPSGPTTATIAGNSVTRCVYMPSAGSSLNGFTITGGAAATGAGVYCVGGSITNCVISSNQAVGSVAQGGGIYCDGATIIYCAISGNNCTSTNADPYNAFANGGGIYAVGQSQIGYSSITGNTLTGYYANGAGINANNGTVQNCTISSNTAYGHWYASGGGVFMTANVNGLIRNCVVSSNNAHTDRGAYTTNSASGGGVHFNSGGTIESSTVFGNAIDGDSSSGGGLNFGGLARNTIIYGNTATARLSVTGPNYYVNPYAATTFDHCCSTPLPAGVGNIASAPNFVSGGFHLTPGGCLSPGSPCIGAGINQAWMAGVTDLDGGPRVVNGTVDIGAYETPPFWHCTQLTATPNVADGSRTGAAHSSASLYFYKGTDSNMWGSYWNGTQWTQAPLTSDANVDDWLSYGTSYGLLAYKGKDNKLWVLYFNGSVWAKAALGTNPNVAGEVVMDNTWNLIYYRGTDSKLWVAWWTGTQWTQTSLGGAANVEGNLTVDGGYHLVYYRSGGQIWCYYWSGTAWQQVQMSTNANVGGSVAADPGGGLAYYRSSADNSAWALYWNGSAWAQTQLDALASMGTANAIAPLAPNAALYLNGTGQCYAEYWNGTGWVSTPLGDGGSGLTGGLSVQRSTNLVFTRRSDGHVVIFYYQ